MKQSNIRKVIKKLRNMIRKTNDRELLIKNKD